MLIVLVTFWNVAKPDLKVRNVLFSQVPMLQTGIDKPW